MTWHLGPMLALDFETTGVDPTECRPVTVALAHIHPGKPADTYTWLVNPGCDIPEQATAVHGITTEHAREHGEDPDLVIGIVAAHVTEHLSHGWPLIAYNAAYDLTLLVHELARCGLGDALGDITPVVDPFVIDKHIDRYRKGNRTLTANCEHYQVRLDGAHDAAADAIAAARLAWRMAQLPEVAPLTLPELHAAQVEWAAEQAASLQDYFRRKDPAAVVDGTWPVRARTQQAAA